MIPASVKDAIDNFVPPAGAILKPPTASERSIIFEWGVRVEYLFEGALRPGWICLADARCRANIKFTTLSCGKLNLCQSECKILLNSHVLVYRKDIQGNKAPQGCTQHSFREDG